MAEVMKQFFNEQFPDEQLGDILFVEDFQEFKSRIKLLDERIQQEYTDSLQEQGIIEICFDDSSDEQ